MAIQQVSDILNTYQKTSNLGIATEKPPANSSQASSTTISQSQITIRNEQQASLVAHLFGDPSKAIEDSLKMTFQAAIEKLNEVLQADLGEYAISAESLKNQGGMEHWTPENTAGRIISGSTAFLAGFQTAHPELEGEALINKFMEVVGGGLQQGFEEAKGILGDLEVFNGKVEDNFTKTLSLVEKGLENFRNQQLETIPQPVKSSETA